MSRPIIIERPNACIPGLLDLNLYLAKELGLNIAIIIDFDKEQPDAPGKWCGIQLHEGSIDANGDIAQGKRLFRSTDDPDFKRECRFEPEKHDVLFCTTHGAYTHSDMYAEAKRNGDKPKCSRALGLDSEDDDNGKAAS